MLTGAVRLYVPPRIQITAPTGATLVALAGVAKGALAVPGFVSLPFRATNDVHCAKTEITPKIKANRSLMN
jgi:hypothetical protein